MTDPPLKKKFKQTTIMDGFKKQQSTASSGGDSVEIIDVDRGQFQVTGNTGQHMAGWTDSTTAKSDDAEDIGANQSGGVDDKPSKLVIPEGAYISDSKAGPADDQNSPILFESSESFSEEENLHQLPSTSTGYEVKKWTKERGPPSRGISRDRLNTLPSCSEVLTPIKSCPSHTVMFNANFPAGKQRLPEPFPKEFEDRWDDNHVKMPCSSENLYPVYVHGKHGKTELQSRWAIIESVLDEPPTNSIALEEAILKYNKRYAQKWCFRGLHAFFLDVLEKEESQEFFKNTLPKMANLARMLPHLCTKAIPLLRKQRLHSITLSQQQIACLLANAFFCTFPRRNARARQSEYASFPEINFIPLFQGPRGGANGITHRKAEKLKCILHYFRRVTTKMPTGTVTFRRQLVKDFPEWEKSAYQLTRLHVTAEGTIEDDGTGMRQMDFANKYLGGGVLGRGLVQEEIRFLICPEMLLSRLFTEALDKNECLLMIGCERFSNYTGYSDSFMWDGNHEDPTPRDSWRRLCTEVAAIDALVFHSYVEQFQDSYVTRELNKAYCGFLAPGVARQHLSAVATGNWGCGAFGGDLALKALIQLMAAAQASRDVCYFTFKDYQFRDKLFNMYELLVEKRLEVSDLLALIRQYYSTECRKPIRKRKALFEFIQHTYSEDLDSTDDTEINEDFDPESQENSAWQDSPNYASKTP